MREWLKELREKNNLTQQNVAERSGVTQQYYSLIENGERQADMSLSMARKLADIFGVPIEKILEKEK